MKNGRKAPNAPAVGQGCCPILWDSPTGSNTTTGQIRRTVEELEDIHYRTPVQRNMPSGTSLPIWTSCRACSRKEIKFWPNSTNRSIFLAEPPE